jgi:hypothetical protein
MARLDGRFPKLVDTLARVQLFILGDGRHLGSLINSASTCSNSSKNATRGDLQSSPRDCPSRDGTT